MALGLIAEAIAHQCRIIEALDLASPTDQLTEILSNRLVAWTSAIALIVAAAYARIIYLLKRHRLDDLRGRYRIWRIASLIAVVMSADSVMGCHRSLARPWGILPVGIRSAVIRAGGLCQVHLLAHGFWGD